MSALRTVLFRLVGVAVLLVLAGGVVYYTVIVPKQRDARFNPAPTPSPTATAATATSVTPPPSGNPAERDGVVYDFSIEVGGCYETVAAASGSADVTPVQRSCDAAHNTVAVGAHTLPEARGATYSEPAVADEAQDLCRPEQDQLVAGRAGYTELTIYPGAGLWATGDRDVGCLVRHEGGDLTGSFAATG